MSKSSRGWLRFLRAAPAATPPDDPFQVGYWDGYEDRAYTHPSRTAAWHDAYNQGFATGRRERADDAAPSQASSRRRDLEREVQQVVARGAGQESACSCHRCDHAGHAGLARRR